MTFLKIVNLFTILIVLFCYEQIFAQGDTFCLKLLDILKQDREIIKNVSDFSIYFEVLLKDSEIKTWSDLERKGKELTIKIPLRAGNIDFGNSSNDLKTNEGYYNKYKEHWLKQSEKRSNSFYNEILKYNPGLLELLKPCTRSGGSEVRAKSQINNIEIILSYIPFKPGDKIKVKNIKVTPANSVKEFDLESDYLPVNREKSIFFSREDNYKGPIGFEIDFNDDAYDISISVDPIPTNYIISLDKVIALNDGTPGSTIWNFDLSLQIEGIEVNSTFVEIPLNDTEDMSLPFGKKAVSEKVRRFHPLALPFKTIKDPHINLQISGRFPTYGYSVKGESWDISLPQDNGTNNFDIMVGSINKTEGLFKFYFSIRKR